MALVFAVLAWPTRASGSEGPRLAWIPLSGHEDTTGPDADPEAREVRTTPGQSLLVLGPYLEVLEDRVHEFDDVDHVAATGRFSQVSSSSVNLGMADSVWWFRFTVRLDPGQDWYFDPDWAYVRTLDFYAPLPASDEQGDLWQLTSHRFGSTTEGRLIPLIADGLSHTYYFRVFSERVSFVRPSLCERNRCLSENNLRSLAFGAFVAVLAAMIVYNFVIFIYIRDRSYLWFVVFHVALLGYFSNKMWTPFFSYELQPLVAATSINFCAIAMCLFLRDFLETGRFHPAWDRLLLACVFPTGALVVLGPFLPSSHMHTMFNLVFNVAVFLMGFGVILSSCLKGRWPGCILLMAWSLVSVLFFIFVATVVGWSNLGYSMGFNLALAAEAVLMSLPLAYRIRQLKLEREASAMAARAKNLFLARMSHEIRTPMAAILGFTDIALRMQCCDQVRQYLLKVKVSAGHLLGLINEILDLAKIEAGKLDVEHKSFDLLCLAREVCEIVAPMAEKNGNELLLEADPDLPVHVFGDPMRLRQVLVNLAGNAVKFTKNGEVRIAMGFAKAVPGAAYAVDAHAFSSGRQRFRFEISDTGPGIPAELIPRLFQAFEQGGGDTASRYGGAGLGLNISSRLVELMGGVIGLSSERGQGSTFWVELDLATDDKPDLPRPTVFPDLMGRAVLVVDDNPAALQSLVLCVTRLGFACEAVGSGQQALTAMLRDPGRFSLVILDWDMPELDGPTTLSRLRATGLPDDVPVLLAALSCHEDPQGREIRDIGAAGQLIKPVTTFGLLDAIMTATDAGQSDGDKEASDERVRLLDQKLNDLRVLLVDDNLFNQEVACAILEDVGAVTAVAFNGLEALQRLEEAKDPYDVVLMDMAMPVMDGLEASRRIRSMEKYRDLPIIAMTANAMKGDREACLAAGMSDHLAKPIDITEFYAVLRRCVRCEDAGRAG
ncbi:hybrid sensor histidine kinase/response regulator [Desulfomicrobium baculatum]|nr:hybrid sensor histidine kinase/response regulator [Desulfomicrobium baculatum]